MATNQSSYFLKLSAQPIIFEPIATATSVFYDKDNQQLFCVRGSGAMGKTERDDLLAFFQITVHVLRT